MRLLLLLVLTGCGSLGVPVLTLGAGHTGSASGSSTSLSTLSTEPYGAAEAVDLQSNARSGSFNTVFLTLAVPLGKPDVQRVYHMNELPDLPDWKPPPDGDDDHKEHSSLQELREMLSTWPPWLIAIGLGVLGVVAYLYRDPIKRKLGLKKEVPDEESVASE